MKKIMPSILMIIILVALSYLLSFIIAFFFNFKAYNVMTILGILIMLVGGLASIDETTMRFGHISSIQLNTMMSANDTSAKKQHELYQNSFKNTAISHFSSKFRVILTGLVVFLVSILVSLV